MNLIDRLADIKIDAWFKSSPRKPMVLRGARQVGKTHLVRAFAKRNQLVLCELNFERRPQLAELFKSDLSPKDILRRIEIIEGVSFDGNTLLFFDEVQECPRALTSIRYFYEESPQVPLVAAGSLLEFILNNSSLPVGRTTFLRLFPLSFEEFLRATNKKHLADELPSFPSKPFNLGLTIHQNYMSAFKEYSLVGGMPEAVARFCETNSFHSATQVHKDLATSYLDDIRKYGLGDLQLGNLRSLFLRSFQAVGKQVNYTKLGDGDDGKRTKKSIELLCQAMVFHKVSSVNPPTLPLASNASEKNFKLIFLDIGLFSHLSGRMLADVINSEDMLNLFDGVLAEQFVGQQLLANSPAASENGSLFCWIRAEKSSSAEVDFVASRAGKVLPIEVKSGKSGTLKSLHLFLQQFGSYGLCLQDIPDSKTLKNIHFWPIYTTIEE